MRPSWRRLMNGLVAAALLSVAAAGCLRPAEDRAEHDRQVGKAEAEGLRVEVDDGLAAVRALDDGALELWAQAPVLSMTLEVAPEAARVWTLTIDNGMPDGALALLGGGEGVRVDVVPTARPTLRRWVLTLPEGDVRLRLRFAPPDAGRPEPFRFAVLSDVQDALDEVQDIYRRVNQDETLRFIVSTGDLVEDGDPGQLRRFQAEMEALDIPIFSTVGNHELGADSVHWARIFGRANVNFVFKGVHFSLVDSGSATIDPTVYGWLEDWLAAARDEVHVYISHIAPIDPVGVRSGSFRSRDEAAKLLTMLARGEVDVTFYGHIHSFYSFSNAGIPAYISGGGGAIEERLDGIARHYLAVRVTPGARVDEVSIIRVE